MMRPQEKTAIQAGRLLSQAKKLMAIYSPFGKEEKAQDYLQGLLERSGLKVRRQPVSRQRHNLIVEPENGEAELVLLGHVDTVAAHDLDQMDIHEEGGRIFGLGSADMKGGLAAMVEAFCVARSLRGPDLPAALAIVVGEEDEGDGAEKFISEYSIPWALIGEPTRLKVCPANFGYVEVHVIAQGERLHASLADLSSSPVSAILDALQRLVLFAEGEHPDWSLNIRDLVSAQAGFAVPDRCEARIDIHVPPGTALEPLVFRVEELVKQVSNRADLQVRFATIIGGYALPEDNPFMARLAAVYAARGLPWEPVPFRSHSDANLLWASGTKPVLMGPGALEVAHTPDEHIPSDEILQAATLYLDILLGL